MQETTASAVFRQLRAAPSDTAAHAAQLSLVRRLVNGELELHLPRKARARALLEWAAGRCAIKEGSNTPSAALDPEYWSLFAQILSLKDESAPSTSNSSTVTPETSNLLSKSDIRQIVLLSRGTSLLAALKTCLETLPTLLPEADSVSLSTFSPIVQPNVASNLLRHLSDVFEILFPLSLSSPTTTLDGLLPCIHAFIRSCGSLASITTSHQNVLSQWNKLGQLLLQTLSSLVKISNSNQDASTNERLLLRKVAGSFLDQASGCKNWKAFTAAYSNVSNLLTAGAATSSAGGKGKGKARDLSNDGQDARSGYETMVGSESMQAYLETLSALLDSFIKVAVFSYANLARWLSASGGASLDTPKQAQESLSELFSTLRASIRPQEASNPSNSSHSTVSVLPVLMDHYIETLSAHSHDLFSPSRRSRNAGDVVNVNVNGSSSTAGSRSAVEYQVQTCFRNAVFGMLQGLTELLKEALPGPAPGKNTSRRKRQRDVSSVDGDVALRRAAATTFRLLLNQIQEKNIYITGGAESNREWLKILEHAARFIVCELLPLSERTEDLDAVTTQAAMQAATSIAKMDNTALEEVLPSLLQTMSKTIPEQQDHFATACHELLDTTVSYKGKVRQLNSYLDTVNKTLSSIIDEAAATSEETSSFVNTMHNMFKAPLLSVRAIAKLSKEARSSLPARQSLPLLKAILGVVQEQALAMQQAREETGTDAKPPKKKTKSGRTSIGGSSVSSIEQERLAWRIHAGIHVIQCILSGNKAATMFGSTSDGLEELQLSMSSIVSQTAHLDIISSANTAEQRIVAAILQLQETWSLFTEKATSLENVTDASLVDVVQSNRALPALRFEIIRTLLSQAASTNAKMAIAERLCDSIIAVLESASDHKEVPWDGYTHSISEEQLPVGIWWLISSKYIDVIERSATQQQLMKIVKFIFSRGLPTTSNEDSKITIPAATKRLLHSADFYEMVRTRDSIFTFIGGLCDSKQLDKAHLDILLLLPGDYLDRAIRRKIVCTITNQAREIAVHQPLLALLKFTRNDAGLPLIKDTDFMLSLARQAHTGADSLIYRLYRQLWELMLQNWSASPESFAALPSFLETLAAISSTDNNDIYLLTWQVLAKEAKIGNIPAEVQTQVRTGLNTLAQSVFGSEDTQNQYYTKLKFGSTVQRVTGWMNSDTMTSPLQEHAKLARSAISALLQQQTIIKQDQQAETAYTALELASMNISPSFFDFGTFVISFWLLAQKLNLTDRQYSSLLARTATAQSEEDYKSGVSTICEAISAGVSDVAFSAALRMLSVLLCNPPDAGARIASQTFSASLRRISLLNEGRSLASVSPEVLRSITAYIKTILEQKIGVPELQDVAVTWTILHDIFTPSLPASSSAPTSSSATAIFLNCVEITSLLATHRRDHVIPTFAQFSRVLSDILQILRLSGASSSSGLKALQSAFPSWALVEHGRWILEGGCSKAVTRLLLGLGTRTTILQRSSARARGTTSASVVALTGPLSKHAPFIMVNYLTAATDSRFPLSPSVRKEINAGILEIISTMGKSEREALMKAYLQSDQEAERALLRVMWKEFDTVRYKGE